MRRWTGGPMGTEYIGGYPTRDIDDSEWAELDPAWAEAAELLYERVSGAPAAPPPPAPPAPAPSDEDQPADSAAAEEGA